MRNCLNYWKSKTRPNTKKYAFEYQKEKDPVLAFCELATQQDFPITVGELFAEGKNIVLIS